MSVRGNFLDSWQSRDRQARTTTATKRPNELTGRRKDGRREGGKADRRLFCLTVLSKLGRRCARASGLCFTDRGNSDGRGCKIPRRSLSLSFFIIHSARQRQWIERKKERKESTVKERDVFPGVAAFEAVHRDSSIQWPSLANGSGRSKSFSSLIVIDEFFRQEWKAERGSN